MSITEERKQKFDFSDPYFESGVVMAIRQDQESIKGYEDLKGKSRCQNRYGGLQLCRIHILQIRIHHRAFDDSAQMYDDVRTGNSVACFDDFPVLAYGVEQNNGLKIVTDMEPGASYGFAVGKGRNQELLEKFNAGLINLKASGEYDRIKAKYIGENAVGAANQSRWELIVESRLRC